MHLITAYIAINKIAADMSWFGLRSMHINRKFPFMTLSKDLVCFRNSDNKSTKFRRKTNNKKSLLVQEIAVKSMLVHLTSLYKGFQESNYYIKRDTNIKTNDGPPIQLNKTILQLFTCTSFLFKSTSYHVTIYEVIEKIVQEIAVKPISSTSPMTQQLAILK